MSRCLWIPILNARAGKTRRHALLRDGEEERIEAVKGVKIVFCFFCFFNFPFLPPAPLLFLPLLALPASTKRRASLDLEYRASVENKAAIPLCPCYCGAVNCERVPTLLWNIRVKPWRLYDVDLFIYFNTTIIIILKFLTKLDTYNNEVLLLSFHHRIIIFCVVLFFHLICGCFFF